jgi:hypothetical protein
MMIKNISRLLIALSLTVGSPVFAQQPAGVAVEVTFDESQLPALPDNIEGKPSRFAYIRKLISTSSGARQVRKSTSPEVHQAYLKAYELYLQAAGEEDEAKVNELLDKTVKQMYAAIRMASPKALTDKKKRRDLSQRLLSVNALLEALQRISVEKSKKADTDKLVAQVEEVKLSAQQLAQKGKLKEARDKLDEAYLTVKTAIENMRSGDTLVRELKFETAEDEYEYELDRNDTHQMLVKVLVEKKLASKPQKFRDRINERVAKALEIRSVADKLAAEHKYEEAIAELEKSTKELVKAIRMGGVFIPG